MSYYNDLTQIDSAIQIDGVSMPETSEPIQCIPELITNGGRVVDSSDYEGNVVGLKHKITMVYDHLNKEHFDLLYSHTMGVYESSGRTDMFFNVTVPTHTPNGVATYRCYLGASSFSKMKCTDTTEKLGGQYGRGGALYDEWHEGVEVYFIEQ